MKVEDVKVYFRQIRKEQNEINHLREMIEHEELLLLPKAITYDKDRVQVSPEDILAKCAAEISDINDEMGRSIVKLYHRKAEAESYISQLDDSDEREVLRWYYLSSTPEGKLLLWDAVAEKMNKEIRTIFRIHGHALRNLSKIM